MTNGRKYAIENGCKDEYNKRSKKMREYENNHCIHINRLPARSTVIPSQKGGIYYYNKNESENIIILNGDYDFTYEGIKQGKTDVPSMWQYRGFGKPRYTNVYYPIPFMPPYVGKYNPVGEYERVFEIRELPEKCILHFDGVDSAFYVYINDVFVGFSKGSRLPSEFDITSMIKKGENKIYIKVYTFSDGSYMECQDMILASGIFRDVYLICTSSVSVWDYRIMPTCDGFDIKVVTDGELSDDTEICVTCENKKITHKAERETEFKINIENPVWWNAEEPYLYDIEIALIKNGKTLEVHSKRMGMRESHIDYDNGIFMLNDTPVTFKGVNRHEYNPENGRAVTYEQTKQELLLIKENNFNAIRCSHYPNNPYFYELCSEIGIYVVDECDLETHGSWVTGDQGALSDNPEWIDAYMDRAQRMYERDKNETCIVVWSLGNESGTGQNLVRLSEYFAAAEIKKPIIYTQDDAKHPQYTDFYQVGYVPLWAVEEGDYFQRLYAKYEKAKPVVFTEFAHMMGNSPGLLYEYWRYIYSHPTFVGGFIWEFKNHGIYKDGTYLYGGDFDDANNAYNFCLDGMLRSDSTPKPSLNEAKNVLSPVWAELDNDSISILNTNDFKSLNCLDITWELAEEYNVIKSGKLDINTPPHGRYRFDIPDFKKNTGCKYYINIITKENGREIGKTQIEIPERTKKKPFLKKPFKYTLGNDEIYGDNFKICFSYGMLSYYEVDGKVLINEPMRVNFYRKPTDNDGIKGKHEIVTGKWDEALIRIFDFNPITSDIKAYEDEVIFEYRGKTCPDGRYVGFDTVLKYRIYKDGVILTEFYGEPYGKMPNVLPKIGFEIKLNKQYNTAEWFGRGIIENYADRKSGTPIGLYKLPVEDMSFEYDRPQENGNRCDNRFVNMISDNNGGITVFGADTFDFTVHDYSLENLMKAEHFGEIEKSKENYLYIDYKTRGLGNASCGSEPERCHELYPHTFRFVFGIKPYTTTESALDFAQTAFVVRTEKLSDEYIYNPKKMKKQNFDCID